ncbi:MAG: cytochrome c [Flavobacteriales bacterium]|jgi:mono/diheme cytochrome c family protein|nr:cytochrome c [Flavobacteriales bacterium]MBK9514462.1 cytochrome c [Flavobacteriales bacterium]
MRTKHLVNRLTLGVLAVAFIRCGGGPDTKNGPPGAIGGPPSTEQPSDQASTANLITPADITLGDIDKSMVEKGRATYDVKCQACHSTGPNRVVGPGWKGVTERRKPEWIMNMMLNIDVMLETDPEAQKGLEECLVRMPNQGLSKEEGREVLEFMRTL